MVAFGVELAEGAGAAVVAFGVELAAGAAAVAFGVDAGAVEVAGALEVAGVELAAGAASVVEGAGVFRVSEPAEVPAEVPPAVEPVAPEAELVTGVVMKPLLISAAKPA